MTVSVSSAAARRIALGSQGFTDRRPTGAVTARHFTRALDRMQIVQLDSVNRVARSHLLPFFSRLGPYDPARLDQWLWRSGQTHEYLSHEASVTPMATRPLLAHRFERTRRRGGTIEDEQPGYVGAVLAEVAERGPLTVRDLTDPGERTGPWWGNPKGKVALARLHSTGRLSVRSRTGNFVTVYDLPERVIPPDIRNAPAIPEAAAEKQLLEMGARAHGIGTATDIADYYRIRMPAARPLLEELVAEGRLLPAEVEGWNEPAFLHPDAKRPRRVDACTLLTPFDPVVWFRPRAERLFDFHYRIEIYVPEHTRVFGYYVLPFLLGDRLVGRVDLATDRAARVLRVLACYREEAADGDEVAPRMAEALAELALFLGMDGVEVGERGPLSAAVRRHC